MNNDLALEVENFSVAYQTIPKVEAVKQVSLTLQRGEILGLAGESGCGKTTLAYGITRLLKSPAEITSGSVIFHDSNGASIHVDQLDETELRRFRWAKASMVFQGAMNALNPVLSIRRQLADVFTTHSVGLSRHEIRRKCVELLEQVGVGGNRLSSYPAASV